MSEFVKNLIIFVILIIMTFLMGIGVIDIFHKDMFDSSDKLFLIFVMLYTIAIVKSIKVVSSEEK